jgi:hypothetical protein
MPSSVFPLQVTKLFSLGKIYVPSRSTVQEAVVFYPFLRSSKKGLERFNHELAYAQDCSATDVSSERRLPKVHFC